MKKLVIRCITKTEANEIKDKAIKKGFNATSFCRNGKYACMISSAEDIPEEVAKAFLGGRRNMAK